LPNGITTSYQYNGLDRLIRLQDTLNTTTIADTQYKHNAGVYMVQQTDQGGTHAYTYDAVYQLKAASYPGQTSESYSYDVAGNRTSSHRRGRSGLSTLHIAC
jgi:YD repeat-containing protein